MHRSDTEAPSFGHLADRVKWATNVAAGHTLCDYCKGGGNEFFSMYRACRACSGSGVAEYAPGTIPIPVEHPRMQDDPARSSACVAPTWPEWACTEEADMVWVRLDLEDQASKIASECVDRDYVLFRERRVPMVLDQVETDWSEDWLLREASIEQADDVAVYVLFTTVEAPVDDEDIVG